MSLAGGSTQLDDQFSREVTTLLLGLLLGEHY